MENWTSEEIENIKSLLFSQHEPNIFLGLELLQTKADALPLFANELIFLEKVIENIQLAKLLKTIITANIDTNLYAEIANAYEIVNLSKYAEKSRFYRALKAYQPLRKKTESYFQLHPAYSLFYKKIAWYLSRQADGITKYKEYFERYLSWMPQDAEAHFDYAFSLKKQSDALEKIIKHYQKSVDLGLRDVAVFHNLGKAYASIHNYQKAEELFRQGLKIAPNFANTYIELAGVVAHRNLQEAELLFLKALEVDPKNALGWNNLACLYWEDLKDYDNAMQAVNQALKIKPKKALYWHTLAEVEWYGYANKEKAINALLKAKKIDPEYLGADAFLNELETN